MADLQTALQTLKALDFSKMYEGDFFLTWEKTDEEIRATFAVADALRALREANVSPKIFDSGLAVSMFRDNSTRTRFSFASACNLLGLAVRHSGGLATFDAGIPTGAVAGGAAALCVIRA